MGKRVNLLGPIHATLCGNDLPNVRAYHTQYCDGATNAIFKLKTMIISAYFQTELRIKSTENTHTRQLDSSFKGMTLQWGSMFQFIQFTWPLC